jgi:hypothetical protein
MPQYTVREVRRVTAPIRLVASRRRTPRERRRARARRLILSIKPLREYGPVSPETRTLYLAVLRDAARIYAEG